MNYHDRPEVSATMLKCILANGWREYEARYVDKTKPDKRTDALDFGNMLETVMLEPHKIGERLFIMPSKEHYDGLLVTMDDLREYCLDNDIKPGRTKDATIAKIFFEGHDPPIWDNIVADANATRGDRLECSMQEWKDIQEIVAIAKAHPIASALFDESNEIQQEYFWTHEATGIKCRCKLDVLNKANGRVLYDVKSTRHETAEAFARDCRELQYWVQDIHYCEGVKASHMVFIGFSKTRPFRVFCYHVKPDSIERELLVQYRETLLQELADRAIADDYSDPYENKLLSLTFPDWWHSQTRAKLNIEEMEAWDG